MIKNNYKNIFLFVFSISSFLFGKELHLPLLSDIYSLDPRRTVEAVNNMMTGHLYESLFKYDSQGKAVPALCEKYEVSEDGLTYIFHLRDSTWSNGDPCTAHDFEYAWKKCCNPETVQSSCHFFYPIKNAERCVKGLCSIEEVGVKALNDKTLQVVLEAPSDYLFVACCTLSPYKPISEKMEQAHPDWESNWKKYLVSNGPFKIKEWKKNYEIILEKNPKYYKASEIKLDGIHFSIIPDNNTAFMMFEKGKLDWIGEPLSLIPQEVIPLDKKASLNRLESNTMDILCYNVLKFPFDNRNFRRAVSIALNRKEIADGIFYLGGRRPTTSYLNGSVSIKPYEYFEDGDEALAKESFQLALKEMNKTAKECSFVFRYRSGYPPIGEILQEKMKLLFDVDVQILEQEQNVHFNDMRAGKFQVAELQGSSFIPDPYFYLCFFKDKNEKFNIVNWETETFKYLFNKGVQCKDPVRKKMYYQLAEEHMIDEMPFIPLFQKIALYKTNPKLKGYYFSPGFYLDFKNAYFEE